MTTRLDTLALALAQTFALVAASLHGERWAIAPAAASVVAFGFVAWRARSAPATEAPRVDGYRVPALRDDDTTVLDAIRAARIVIGPHRHALKRVMCEEYRKADDHSFFACLGAVVCGSCGFAFGALAWDLRAGWPLPICAGFTIGGFALLGWWSYCRATVRAWRDQERERGER